MPTEGKMLPLVHKDRGLHLGVPSALPDGQHQRGHVAAVVPGCFPTSARPVPGTGELCSELLVLPENADLRSLPHSIPFSERSPVRATAQWSRRLLKLIMAF